MSADAGRQVLRARARALARVTESALPAEHSLELLEFALADERYAVESRHVVEVHPFRDLTPLPGTPAFMRGIVNLRGRILAVFDLKRFFDLPERGVTDLHRIVVVRGNGLELGLLADTVKSVRHVPRESLAPTLPTLSGIGAEYLLGVNDERLVVLDLERVFADPRIVVDEDVSE